MVTGFSLSLVKRHVTHWSHPIACCRGLRHKLYSLAPTPGSWVGIPLKAWDKIYNYILSYLSPCSERVFYDDYFINHSISKHTQFHLTLKYSGWDSSFIFEGPVLKSQQGESYVDLGISYSF
jgi:hypothetical protein